MNPDALSTGVITFLGTGTFATLISAYIQRKKTKAEVSRVDADSAKVLTDIATGLTQDIEVRYEKLNEKYDSVNAKADALIEQNRHLEAQNRALLRSNAEHMESNDRLSHRVDIMEDKQRAIEARESAHMEILHIHAEWDRMVIAALASAGIVVADSPALYVEHL